MTLDEFRASLAQPAPPAALTPALKALWQDGKNDWHAAHETAQDIDDETGAWIHAYLHRKEGDQGNAEYWYRRARKPVCRTSLQEEWDQIVTELISR